MSIVPSVESRPAVLAESAGIIVNEGVVRQEMIATNAYYRAERRGFNGGDEIQDWLEAEAEIDNTIKLSI